MSHCNFSTLYAHISTSHANGVHVCMEYNVRTLTAHIPQPMSTPTALGATQSLQPTTDKITHPHQIHTNTTRRQHIMHISQISYAHHTVITHNKKTITHALHIPRCHHRSHSRALSQVHIRHGGHMTDHSATFSNLNELCECLLFDILDVCIQKDVYAKKISW